MWPFSSWNAQQRVDQAVNSKRASRVSAIKQGLAAAGPVDGNEDSIYLESTACNIVQKIRDGEWTCQRVMEAFVRSAAQAHERTNCLTEIMFTQALDSAKQQDKLRESFSDDDWTAKPLFGLPISLKDQLDVAGFDSCIGMVRYTSEPAKEDAVLVHILKDLGAIPFVKTNVPQTMLAFECANPVWGVTVNPFSSSHTPGGSSGGEGALLGANGSPLGIGSDIGGSLRIPAHFCGCYAIKPVAGRWPSRGARGTIPGYEAIQSTLGPMGRSVQDLRLVTQAVYNATIGLNLSATELLQIPIPYRRVELPRKLRLGYYVEDNFIPTSPACARATQLAVDAMTAAGHECVPISLPDPIGALSIFQALASADSYCTLLSNLVESEPKEPALFLPTVTPKIPAWFRWAIIWLLRTFAGEHAMARLMSVSHLKPVHELLQWQKKRNDFRLHVRNYLWKEERLDAIIAPTQATPAITHGSTKRLSPLAIHTIYWNVVDSTVGLIPVTRVDEQLDAMPSSFKAKIDAAGTKLLSRELYSKVYDSKAMSGLPVGVQLIAPAHEDEKVIEIMQILDDALIRQRGKAFGPGANLSHAKVY